MKAAAAPNRLRMFQRYNYVDPYTLLFDLRQIEGRMGRDLPYNVRSLRTHELRKAGEGRVALPVAQAA